MSESLISAFFQKFADPFLFLSLSLPDFMGNEFGHPEVSSFCHLDLHTLLIATPLISQWLELPSVANGFRSRHAKRQWGLADPERSLRFSELGAFDKQMMWAEERGGWGSGALGHVFTQDDVSLRPPFFRSSLDATDPFSSSSLSQSTGLIVFLRSSHLFLVNFHPTRISRAGKYPVPEQWNEPGQYKVILSTDGGLAGTQVTSTCEVSFRVLLSSRSGTDGACLLLPARRPTSLRSRRREIQQCGRDAEERVVIRERPSLDYSFDMLQDPKLCYLRSS